MSFIAVICGLKSEEAAIDKSIGERNIRIGVSGANAKRAEELARDLCTGGAAAIVSVGVSGGLDPALAPGTLVIGDKVVAGAGGEWQSNMYLLHAAQKAKLAQPPVIGALFGSDIIIDDVETKGVLHSGHECIAVDMESHGAARAAARAGVPFIAIRAIADPANRALPEAAMNAVAPDGSTRVLETLGAAMRDPKQFPELIRLGRDSAAATKTLNRDLEPIFSRLFRSLNL